MNTTRSANGSNDQTFVHDQANQISKEGVSTLSNDKNGNFLGGTNPLAFTWDNRLDRYISSAPPAATHTWRYDALGRRVQWSEARTYRYYFDGDQIVEHVEFSAGSETSRKQYVWGEWIDDLLFYQYQIPNPDEDYYCHTDHLGSVQLMCDSSGAILESYRYWEWGQTTIVDSSFAKLTGTASTSSNNVRYAGRDQYTVLGDQNDSWYNNRARAYRTKWGRFTSRDKLGYRDAPDLYAAFLNTPVMVVDPSGNTCTWTSPVSNGGVPSDPPTPVSSLPHTNTTPDAGCGFADFGSGPGQGGGEGKSQGGTRSACGTYDVELHANTAACPSLFNNHHQGLPGTATSVTGVAVSHGIGSPPGMSLPVTVAGTHLKSGDPMPLGGIGAVRVHVNAGAPDGACVNVEMCVEGPGGEICIFWEICCTCP